MVCFQQQYVLAVKSITGGNGWQLIYTAAFVLWRWHCHRRCVVISHGPDTALGSRTWTGIRVGEENLHICVCARELTGVCFYLYVPVLWLISQISELDAERRGKKQNETLQCCRPLIKSLKYSSDLHKNLGSKQQRIFLSSSSSVADYIFFLVAQAAQLPAVCISNTNSSCS